VIMHQQAPLLPVKWDHVNGGGAETVKEGWRGCGVFKDAAAMGKLPPAHEIDSVHLAQ